MSSPSISIVIPVYKGEKTVAPLVAELERVLGGKHSLEIILVNDASPDGSLDVCLTAQKNAKCRVTVLDLSRNFGEHNAVMAGLHKATGGYVVIMDDDFPNPPSEVPKLIAKAAEGHDVVFSKCEKKKEA